MNEKEELKEEEIIENNYGFIQNYRKKKVVKNKKRKEMRKLMKRKMK
jgi:hypothetical protein